MAIEEKLDQIIEILLRIEKKFAVSPENAAIEEKPIIEQPTTNEKQYKPTKSQLIFQRRMELGVRLYRNDFLTAIREYAGKAISIKDKNPEFKFTFECDEVIKHIDEKIAKSPAIFYKDLKERILLQIKAVEQDGVKTLDRAIGRLKARAR